MNETMLAFWFFAAIAAGGLLMFGMIMQRKRYPGLLKLGHGLGALLGVCGLAYVNFSGGEATANSAWWALALFAMGMVGGVLFFRFLFPRSAPNWLILGHGSLGGLALFFLYQAAF